MQQQLEWGRFWKLLEFGDRVDKLLEVSGHGSGEGGGIGREETEWKRCWKWVTA